jgi:hypothetical protein
VAGDLHHVFARVAVRRTKDREEHVVNFSIGAGELAQRGVAGGQPGDGFFPAPQGVGDFDGARSA